MNFSKLFGGEHPSAKKPEEKPAEKPGTIPHPSDERITFFETTQARVAGEGGLALKSQKPKVASAVVTFSNFEVKSPSLDAAMSKPQVLHSSAFHIKPTMPESSVGATSQPIVKPTSMTVKIGESASVKVPVDKPANFAPHQEEDLSALISRAEDPNTPAHVRAILHSDIIERQSRASTVADVSALGGPSEEESLQAAVPQEEVPVDKPSEQVGNPFDEEKETSEVEQLSEPLTDEQKLVALVENIKTAPVKERPAMLREIARLKRTEKEKEERKEAIGNKIMRSSGDAAKARAQKETLEARIEAEKQTRKEKQQPETGAFLTKLEKRLSDAVNTLSRAEQSYKDLTAEYLALGGTQDEIEALLASNTDEESVEKPLVGEDDARKEELEAIAEEVADPILGAMVAGLAVEGLGEGSEKEAVLLPVEQIDLEQGESLEQALEKARRAYVQADVANRDKIERLSLHFPWLKNEKDVQKNPDLIQLKESYLNLRRTYQKQELEKLKSTPKEQDLKQFLFENHFGEALNLDNEYQSVLQETRGLGGKILSAYEGMGNWYNGLSLKKKAAIGATLFAGSLALGATGLGIGVPAIVWLRRFMAGSGSAMKLDAITEKWQEGANAKRTEQELRAKIEKFREGTPQEFESEIMRILGDFEKDTDQELLRRRKSRAKRKWGSRLAGAFGGVAISELVAHGFAPETVEAAGIASATDTGVEQDMQTAAVSSSPEGVVSPENASLPAGDASPEVGVAAGAGIESVAGFPRDYVVTANDGGRGLWGVLEKSLPAGMPEADRVDRITALEKIIAAKVANLSPELQAEYGFRGGDINVIQPGSTIQFDKLLTPEEWQNPASASIPMAETNVGTPAVEGVPSRIDEHFLDGLPADTETVAETTVEGVTQEVQDGAPENLLEGVEIGSSNLVVEEIPVDPTRSVLESGVDSNTFRESLQNFRIGVLTTPETANWLKYNPVGHAFEMKSVPMGEIIAAHESIVLNGTYDTALPFHQSQIEKLHEMTAEAVKTYGDSARPGRLETFETYTRRLIALGFQNASKN